MLMINWIRNVLGTNGLYPKVDENNRLLHELNWANVFNSTISNSKWLEDKSFSPGRAALGYPQFYLLYRILNEIEPESILEFGLGQSSIMLSRYASTHRNSQVTTLEHDPLWQDFFLKQNDIPSNAKILLVENKIIEFNSFETLSIHGLDKIVQKEKYDLIIIDAPFGSSRYSRSQILSLIPINLNPEHFCIIMDDYDRPGEKETCLEIEKILNRNSISFNKGVYKGLKECVLYCSIDLKFLTTL